MTIRERDIGVGSFEEAAASATGTAVVIDVFRAFTTGAIALANGAARIIMVGDLDEALGLRDSGAAAYALGERHGLRPDGFDFGNSPAEIARHRFDGLTVVQTTSNGTRGVLAASGARRAFAASLVNARATADAILADPILPISLVAMGDRGPNRRDEDEICALYLRALILGRSPDRTAAAALTRSMADLQDTRRLSDADVAACLQIDTVPFAIRVTQSDGRMIAMCDS